MIETNEDGGVRIEDHGMGPIADQFFGRGEIEASLVLTTNQVRDLYGAIGGWKGDKSFRPALCLAIGFAIKFSGHSNALSEIQDFCQSYSVEPKKRVW